MADPFQHRGVDPNPFLDWFCAFEPQATPARVRKAMLESSPDPSLDFFREVRPLNPSSLSCPGYKPLQPDDLAPWDVVSFADGDTFTVRRGDDQRIIRLHLINAPECGKGGGKAETRCARGERGAYEAW